ncbi:hypothetical protein [Candidatus Cyanaurora vandensis]|nr:hypothetical protein [Candidatus Cyanaurora vandensis]
MTDEQIRELFAQTMQAIAAVSQTAQTTLQAGRDGLQVSQGTQS